MKEMPGNISREDEMVNSINLPFFYGFAFFLAEAT